MQQIPTYVLQLATFKTSHFGLNRKHLLCTSCLLLALSYFTMKAFTILSLLGLLSSITIAAPSHFGKKDVNIFLHESGSDYAETASFPDLKRGTYIITSPGLPPGFTIGRGIEDRSLNPKKIKTVRTWDDRAQIKVIPTLNIFLLTPQTNIFYSGR
jgi:hypothetical protein